MSYVRLWRIAMAVELAAARATPAHADNLQWLIEHQVRHLAREIKWLDKHLARRVHARTSAPAARRKRRPAAA